jgi:hypothetical protein
MAADILGAAPYPQKANYLPTLINKTAVLDLLLPKPFLIFLTFLPSLLFSYVPLFKAFFVFPPSSVHLRLTFCLPLFLPFFSFVFLRFFP